MYEASIEHFAEATSFVECALELQCPGAVVFNPAFLQTQFVGAFRARNRTATIRNFRLRDVVVDGETLFVYKCGRLIAETASLRHHLAAEAKLPASIAPTVERHLHVIFGCNPNWRSYTHWMLQCLPAIDWSVTPRTATTHRQRNRSQKWVIRNRRTSRRSSL